MGIYFRHRSSLDHDMGAHPENPGRIRAIERTLDGAGWRGLEVLEAPEASREAIERVHDPAHYSRLERLCAEGGGMIDADTVATGPTWEAALRAAGAAAEGAARILAGEDAFAFTGMRPPGHHAESARAMGFCFFNNAAVAAGCAIAECGVERVLILDWDVHHGNGTAGIFDSRADVLYASIHQSPLYPGTGAAGDIGAGEGEGYTLNLPVPAGADGELFCSLVQQLVVPIGREYAPGLIVLSAGYDAHADDPLGNCELSTGDYGRMTASMRDLARELGVPVLICLEGGYDPSALAASVLATIDAMGGEGAPEEADPVLAEPARRFFGNGRWERALSR